MAKKKKRKGGKKQPGLYDLALKLVTKQYAPAVAQARESVKAGRAHIKAGGAMDQAYDRSGANIAASQKTAQDYATGAAASTKDAAGMGVDATAALGAEQVARAQQQANLYGQTADAAEVAARTQGAAAASLGGAGANMAGFLQALGAIQSNFGVAQTAANEARRGEARTQLSREVHGRELELQNLRTQRAGDAQKMAADMKEQEDQFVLAMQTLGLKERDSRRDYRATLAGIAAQKQMNDADNQTSASNTQANNQNDLDVANANNRAKYDLDGDGDIDQRDRKLSKRYGIGSSGSGGSGSSRYSTTVHVGRRGEKIKVAPGTANKFAEGVAKWQNYYDRVANLMGSGKYTTAEDARKAAGGKQYGNKMLWEIAWTARANRGKVKHTIPNRYKSALAAMFPGGRIPTKIARAIQFKE